MHDTLPGNITCEEKREAVLQHQERSTWYFVLSATYVDPAAVVTGCLPLAAVRLRAANGSNAAVAVISLRPINWNYRPVPDGRPYISICREAAVDEATSCPPGRADGTTPDRARPRPAALESARCRAGQLRPPPHRSTNSIKASLGNAERRPPFAHDTGQAHAGGHRARSLTLAKRPCRAITASRRRPITPASRRPAQVKRATQLSTARRGVGLTIPGHQAPTHRGIGGANSHGLAA